MAALKWTLQRDSDAANVIQRLVSRVDRTSELAQRAREYAAELRSVTLRLQAYLSDHQFVGGTTRTFALAAADEAIEVLDQRSATDVLIRYLIQHAEATYEVLSGVGNGLNAKAVAMLCRKVAREKEKILAWLERHGRPSLQH
jgi:hypothetical protein